MLKNATQMPYHQCFIHHAADGEIMVLWQPAKTTLSYARHLGSEKWKNKLTNCRSAYKQTMRSISLGSDNIYTHSLSCSISRSSNGSLHKLIAVSFSAQTVTLGLLSAAEEMPIWVPNTDRDFSCLNF